MQKQNASKSKALGIVIAAIAVVLVALLGLAWGLGWFSGSEAEPTEPTGQTEPGEGTEPTEPEGPIMLSWNIERSIYAGTSESGLSGRVRDDADNLYHILFAENGRSVYRLVDDPKVVNRIDGMDLMYLVSEGAMVVDVKAVEEVTGGIVYKGFYVDKVENNTVTVNSVKSMDGMSQTFTLMEDTQIYDVTGNTSSVGVVTTLEPNDRILAVEDYDGNITHVYVTAREVDVDFYWNITRMYDSTSNKTTRVPDENGEYSILFAVNGTQVTLKTKDQDVATTIDSFAAKAAVLKFDEDGYITSAERAWNYTGGVSFASWYDIVLIDGRTIYAEKLLSGSDKGTTVFGTMTDSCGVYDVSGAGEFVGVATELRVGDRIQGCTNARGEVVAVWIVNRLVESDIYWNVERMWDSNTSRSTRTKSSDGYYHFTLAVRGRQIDVKTTDREIVNMMDGVAAKCFGLKLNGNIIEKMYYNAAVTGGGSTASWADIESFTDSKTFVAKKTIAASDTGTVTTVTMAENCEVYNVSTSFVSFVGEVTSLRVGDRVHCLTNAKGEAVVVYVVNRYADVPIFWSKARMYNSTTKETTRKPAEDGYYYFEMASEGKAVTVKTNNKAFATQIDAVAGRTVGLLLNGDVITKVYTSNSISAIRGGAVASWYNVTSLNGRKAHVYKYNGEPEAAGREFDITLASNCKIYNVSGQDADKYGEATQLHVGDQIHCYKNANGEVTYVFIISANTHGTQSHWCEHCNQEVTWINWNGTSGITSSGHYYLDRDVTNGSQVSIGTAGSETKVDIVICLNGRTVSSNQRVFLIRDNATLSIVDHEENKGVLMGYGYPNASGAADHSRTIMNNGGVLNVYGGTITAREDAMDATHGGVIGIFGANGAMNMYGGSVVGRGTITGNGGAISVSNGSLTVYDGAITGAEAANGGAIYVASGKTLNLFGGTVTGGKATLGGGIYAASGSSIHLAGAPVVENNTESNLYLASGVVIELGEMREGADIGVTLEGGYGAFTTATSESNLPYFHGDNGSDISFVDGALFLGDPAQKHVHTVWGVEGEHDHDNEDIEWQPWGSTTTLPTQAGYWYLTEDVNLSAQTSIQANQNVYLCLNGKKVTYDFANGGDPRIYSIHNSGASLTITDCSEEETGVLLAHCANTVASQGSVVWVRDNNFAVKTSFNLYRGTLDGGGVTNSLYGSTVSVASKTTFNMYGGTVIGGTTTHNDGGGALHTAGTTVIYDGTIIGGKANNFGGAIYNSGNLTVKGGTVIGGEANRGGAIFNSNNSKLNLEGGLIKDGKATDVGGNISIQRNSLFKMTGGTVTGGTAANGANFNGFTLSGDTLTVEISGGTIDGGVRIQDARVNVTLSGNPVIRSKNDDYSLYLASGVLLDVAEMTEGADIGITLATYGPFTKATAETNLAYFHADVEGETVTYDSGALQITNPNVAHEHSLWGVAGAHDHDDENVVWEPWSSDTTLPDQAGHWYLTKDVTLSTQTTIKENQGVYLCLNGKTVSYDFDTGGDNRIYSVHSKGASLTITDCSENETGILRPYGEKATASQGTVVWVRDFANTTSFTLYRGTLDASGVTSSLQGVGVCVGWNSAFNMYGGTIIGGTTTHSDGGAAIHTAGKSTIYGGTVIGGESKNFGGAIYNIGGELTIKGGTVIGGEANRGGSIFNANGTKLNIEGGIIKDGKASDRGGNISLQRNSTLKISGGTITGGTAPNGSNIAVFRTQAADTPKFTLSGGTIDGGIHIYEGVTVTVSGNPVIRGKDDYSLYLASGILLNLEEMTDGADIGITLADGTGAFTTATDEANLAYFTADSDALAVIYKDGALCLEIAASLPHSHSECFCGEEGHDHAAQVWEPWTSTNSLPKAAADSGKYYYLTQDLTITSQQSIAADTDIHLCLNGHTVTYKLSKDRLYSVHNSGASLSITDCSKEETGKLASVLAEGTTSATAQGTVVWIRNASSFTKKTSFNLYRGTLDGSQMTGTGTGVTICVDATTSFTMYGGTVIGGKGGEYGGAIYNSGTVTIKDGTVIGGSANRGGSIFNSNGSTLIMEGGTIKDGTATDLGGNVSTQRNSVFKMTGGTITGGTATNGGENFNAFTISGDALTIEISGGTIDGGARIQDARVNVTVSGNPVIRSKDGGYSLHLASGILLDVKDMTTGADIGVTLAAYGPFTSATEEAYVSYFHADKEGETVTRNADGQLEILAPTAIAAVASGMIRAVRETVQAII